MREMVTPCFVIGPRGVSIEDGWCYGKSRYLGDARDDDDAREVIKTAILEQPDYNGSNVYRVSDHGNVCRSRAIRLRKGV